LKVILDTNIIVSALLSPHGLSAKILSLVLNGKLTIVYDNIIFAEYADVLNRNKFKLDKELVNLVIDFIAKEGEYVIAEFQNIKFTDEDDKAFYEVYKSGYVDYLITGNKKHFPKEKGIITAREFFDVYEQYL
jgi:putative PIN family toxin of toxin-antitoxin system